MLLVDEAGTPQRIDRPIRGMRHWRAWHDAHGDQQCRKGDPYTIDVLFMYMANMSWNRR